MSEFYIHFSFGNNTCNMDREKAKIAEDMWSCKGCYHPKPDVKALDAHIMDNVLDGQLNCVWGYALPLARKTFLLRFGEDRVRQCLYIGKVFGPDGELMEDWVTYRGKHSLIVRGTQDAGYRVCDQCGRNVYAAGPRRYLYPAPHEGIEMFQSQSCGLIVPEDIVKELRIGKAQGFRMAKLPVLSQPLDGLPPLPFYDENFRRQNK